MKKIITYILIVTSFHCFGQKVHQDIKTIEGIWIAEDYYKSFEKSNSAIESKNSFYHSDPVALRINSDEMKNGILNIGYSVLHDHMLHPEVSEFLVKQKDTIPEQGNFKIDLSQKDSIGYFKTSEIYYFNYEWISYMKWNTSDTTITLYRPKNEKHEEKYIRYTRIESSFKKNYQFPNPLYYYTRLKALVGSYILKDSVGNVLSNDLRIKQNGIISGYHKFQGFTAYFSTDIYCGPPVTNDFILFYEDILNDESKGFGFAFKKSDNGNISLYKREWKTVDGREVLGLSNLKYELIKN